MLLLWMKWRKKMWSIRCDQCLTSKQFLIITRFYGAQLVVSGACVCPTHIVYKTQTWKWCETVSIDRIVLFFFFFLSASESVYHLVWYAFQSIKSFDGIWFSTALMLCSRFYKNRHFVCRVPGEGKKKADNVLDANNGCQWHRGWHQTLFV